MRTGIVYRACRSLFFILLLFAFLKVQAQQQKVPFSNTEYTSTLKSADNLLQKGDYLHAILEYENAWDLYPRQVYTEKKLEQIYKTLENTETKNILYKSAVHLGDSLFEQKNYSKANIEYYLALRLHPDEQYPKDQLIRIMASFDDPANDKRYRIVITHALKSFDKKKYDRSIGFYRQALLMKPTEIWINKRIEDIQAEKTKAYSSMDAYDKQIVDADFQMDQKKWSDARSSYSKALEIHPEKPYPAARIYMIDQLLRYQSGGVLQYDTLVNIASRFYKIKDYENAYIYFQQALSINPDGQYPKTMAKRLGNPRFQDNILVKNYDAEVQNADYLSLAGNSEAAMIGYQRCLSMQPGDDYVTSRVRELSSTITTSANTRKAYQLAISNGDISMEAYNYSKALSEYKYALILRPEESYPKNKIEEVSRLMATQGTVAANSQKENSKPEKTVQPNLAPEKSNKKVSGKEDLLAGKTVNSKQADSRKTATEAEAEPEKTNHPADAKELKLVEIADKTNSPAATDLKMQSKLQVEKQAKKPASKIEPSINEIKYKDAIDFAEKSLADNNNAAATNGFKAALKYKPGDKYANEKIKSLSTKNVSNNQLSDSYTKLITAADHSFDSKKLKEALQGYKQALDIRPAESYPKERIALINSISGQAKKKEDLYKRVIKEADVAFDANELIKAELKYKEALESAPDALYPKQRLAALQVALGKKSALNSRYEESIAKADQAAEEKDYVSAAREYKNVAGLLPEKTYPKERLSEINKLIADLKEKQEEYKKVVMTAEKAYAAKNYTIAINEFDRAGKLNPDDPYPSQRIGEINRIIALDKEQRDNQYLGYLNQADALFKEGNDLPEAQKQYQRASSIKPEESYPRNKADEIAAILISTARNEKAAYDLAVSEADYAYGAGTFDLALAAYAKALKIKPGEIYPGQMIARIRKFMIDNAMVVVNSDNFILKSDTEKRFGFKPVAVNQRKNNYLLIRARTSGDVQPKLYLNYGVDKLKNGGIVIKNIEGGLLTDFVINISLQDKWFREDNNWLSLYSENGDVEVGSVRISHGK
ncbi:MAG: hypothetical protein HXX13_06375 [Bacteroidetes bacterium]|nr:hypothetical protein [Bacteroidota bacterium]